jgi:acetate CoA/acetoacetate CoA-transferase alpha subunit
VEKGKQKLNVGGKDYLLETPLSADYALVKATVCDTSGNVFTAGAAKNFNLVMAMAAKRTIAETEKWVKTGEMDNEKVTIPGVFVHEIVEAR